MLFTAALFFKMMKTIFTKQIWFHILFISILTVVIFLPVMKKASVAPVGTVYTQVHRIHEDYYYYLMVIRQGRTGFQEIDQYTTEDTKPNHLHIFYLILGKLGQAIGASDIIMYWGSMYVSFLLFYIFTVALIGQLVPAPYQILALFIAFLGSPLPDIPILIAGRAVSLGAGWWTGMDIYSRLTLIPHHFFTSALFLASVYYFLVFFQKQNLKFAILSAILNGMGILLFPVPGFIFFCSFICFICIFGMKYKGKLGEQKELLLGIGAIIITSLAALSLSYWQLSSLGFPWVENLKWEYETYKAAQYPYMFWVYLISYGIFPLFIIPVILQVRRLKISEFFILILTFTPPILYLLSEWGILHITKIRFVYSAPFVLTAIFATLGISKIIDGIKNTSAKKLFFILICFIFVINTVWGLTERYWWSQLNNLPMYGNYYIPQENIDAVKFLNSNTRSYSTVLASYFTGVYIPAFSHNKVFIGHEGSTFDFWTKWYISNRFFDGLYTGQEAGKMLRDYKISYVWWDRGELPTAYRSLLEPIFGSGSVRLYKVK